MSPTTDERELERKTRSTNDRGLDHPKPDDMFTSVRRILASEAVVARCHAHLFCDLVKAILDQIRQACEPDVLLKLVDAATSLLRASAFKEFAIAEVLGAALGDPKGEGLLGENLGEVAQTES